MPQEINEIVEQISDRKWFDVDGSLLGEGTREVNAYKLASYLKKMSLELKPTENDKETTDINVT